jgi:hypothetical protein
MWQVLTEPRNAIGKQYKKLFAMNNVSLIIIVVLLEASFSPTHIWLMYNSWQMRSSASDVSMTEMICGLGGSVNRSAWKQRKSKDWGSIFSSFSFVPWYGDIADDRLLWLWQVKLLYTEGALRRIAQKAMSKNTGARGLRTIMETLLTDAMYQVYTILLLLWKKHWYHKCESVCVEHWA